MKNIKLIISEVDGVITTGTNPVDELGNSIFKNFYMADFEAVNKLKEDYIFAFLSSDNSVSYNFFRSRSIPFFWAKKDKLSELSAILMRYNVTAEDTLYVGSKLSDIPCMRMIPMSFCTNRLMGFNTFDTAPGAGILTELYLKYFK
ncbi:hypothetical protein JZU46_02775 [bacterium]|nr:hypothetical protein [bacterium]